MNLVNMSGHGETLHDIFREVVEGFLQVVDVDSLQWFLFFCDVIVIEVV